MSVSIVIPVYNIEKYLPKCLDGVCAQDDCVKEIILVNDGSTDGSLDICNEYAQKDGRIKIIDKQNEGVAAAVIDGVNASSCDYIGFVDGDDYIEQNMFKELANAIMRSGADIALCDYNNVDENGNFYYRRNYDIEDSGTFEKHNGEFPIHIFPTFSNSRYITGMRWNKLYRRDILVNNIAFKKTGIRVGEDLALVLPVVVSANKIVYVKQCLYHYLQRGDSAVHTYKRKNLDDWEQIARIIFEAVETYGYPNDKIKETALCLLLPICLTVVRHSGMTRSQRMQEYKYIGSNALLKELLNTVKITGRFKRKMIFKLLKLKLYRLLSLVY